MSRLNSAVCLKCGRIGNKIEMERVKDGDFVKGYKHKDCDKDMHIDKTPDTPTYDLHNTWSLKLTSQNKRNVYDW